MAETKSRAERIAEIEGRLKAAGTLERCENKYGTPSLARPGKGAFVEAVLGSSAIDTLLLHAPTDLAWAVAELRGLEAENAQAEAYIASLRGPLLEHFGTTDPELLAETWRDSVACTCGAFDGEHVPPGPDHLRDCPQYRAESAAPSSSPVNET